MRKWKPSLSLFVSFSVASSKDPGFSGAHLGIVVDPLHPDFRQSWAGGGERGEGGAGEKSDRLVAGESGPGGSCLLTHRPWAPGQAPCAPRAAAPSTLPKRRSRLVLAVSRVALGPEIPPPHPQTDPCSLAVPRTLPSPRGSSPAGPRVLGGSLVADARLCPPPELTTVSVTW